MSIFDDGGSAAVLTAIAALQSQVSGISAGLPAGSIIEFTGAVPAGFAEVQAGYGTPVKQFLAPYSVGSAGTIPGAPKTSGVRGIPKAATGGQAYFLGGKSTGVSTSFYSYNGSYTSDLFAYPFGISDACLVELANGDILAAGGEIADGSITTAAHIWDHVANTWTSTGAMVTGLALASMIDVGDYVIALGGKTADGWVHAPQYYNKATGVWHAITWQSATLDEVLYRPGLMLTAGGYFKCASANGRLYTMNVTTVSGEVSQLVINQDAWLPSPNDKALPVGIKYGYNPETGVVDEGRYLVIGMFPGAMAYDVNGSYMRPAVGVVPPLDDAAAKPLDWILHNNYDSARILITPEPGVQYPRIVYANMLALLTNCTRYAKKT